MIYCGRPHSNVSGGAKSECITRLGAGGRPMKPYVLTIVLAVLIGLILGVGFYAFIYAKGYSYLASDPAACTNCHVMRGYHDGW